jgi:hypothetical protein
MVPSMEKANVWSDNSDGSYEDKYGQNLVMATGIKQSSDDWKIPLAGGSAARIMRFASAELGGKSVEVRLQQHVRALVAPCLCASLLVEVH